MRISKLRFRIITLQTFALLGMIGLFAFLPHKHERKIFRQIDARQKEWISKNGTPHAKREIASEGTDCLSERAQFPYLKEDVGALEAAKAGIPLSGNWRGLDLSLFSRPAGELLQGFSDFILESPDYDFSSCKTVPCIINTLYKKPDGREGYLAYGFYLKTGYFPAMNNKAINTEDPAGTYRGVTVPFENFLFTENELTLLYRIAYDLPENLKHLPTLKTLHHSPTGMILEKTKVGYVAGLASDGWIALRLLDDTIQNSDHGWTGSALSTILHEMTHSYDFSIRYYSNTAPWKDLSGWFIDEVVRDETDESEKNKKTTTRTWAVKTYDYKDVVTDEKDDQGVLRKVTNRVKTRKNPPLLGFEEPATWYAFTSPTEDFAETNAYLYYQSDSNTEKNLKNSPKKTGYFSDHLYTGRFFWPEVVRPFYIERALTSVQEDFYLKSDDCQKAENREACINDLRDQSLASAFHSIRSTTTDGCALFSNTASTFNTLGEYQPNATPYTLENFKSDTQATTQKWLDTVFKSDPEIGARMKAMKTLRDALPDKIDIRELYVSCYSELDSEKCYNAALITKINELASSTSSQFPAETKKTTDLFALNHSFAIAAAQSSEAVKSLAAPILPHAREQIDNFYKSCRLQSTIDTRTQASTEEGSLLFDPWNGGKEFVAADFIDCINRELLSESLSLVEEVKASIPEKLTENHERLIKHYFEDFMKDTLNRQVSNDRTSEKQVIQTQTSKILEYFTNEVLNNPTWIKGTATKAEIVPACEKASLGLFTQSLRRAGNPGKDLFFFNDWKEVYNLRYERVCQTAASSNSVGDASRIAFEKQEKESLERYHSLLVKRGLELIEACKTKKEKSLLKKISFAPVFYMWQIDVCLNKNWEQLKTDTSDEFLKTDPYPLKAGKYALNFPEYFFIHESELKSELQKTIDKKTLLKR